MSIYAGQGKSGPGHNPLWTPASMGNDRGAADVQHEAQQWRSHPLALVLDKLTLDAANQWHALQHVKAQLRAQERSLAAETERAQLERLLNAQQMRYDRDEAALTRYSISEKRGLTKAPLPTTFTAIALQRHERQLMTNGDVTAAAQTRRDATQAEQARFRVAFEEQSALLDRRVSRRATQLLARETLVLEHDRFTVTLLQHRNAERQHRVAVQVRQVEDGMLSAQRRTQWQVLRLRRHDDASRARLMATQRGTTLERRVYGDAYRVPSLSATYGPMLDNPADALPAL